MYMPGFNLLNHRSDNATHGHIEDYTLYMPSDLSKSDICRYCPNGLAILEDRIRFAEASDALETLHHQLHTRSFANKFKITNVTGQVKNTRA